MIGRSIRTVVESVLCDSHDRHQFATLPAVEALALVLQPHRCWLRRSARCEPLRQELHQRGAMHADLVHALEHGAAVEVAGGGEDDDSGARLGDGKVVNDLLPVLLRPLQHCVVEVFLGQPCAPPQVPIDRELVVLRVAHDVRRADERQPICRKEALPTHGARMRALALVAYEKRRVVQGHDQCRLVLERGDVIRVQRLNGNPKC
mmetsp:Transcript_70055/g.193797  ORF Transcript_70055/g.193797 Transcript_70055/m.193797 type:complete len:205 (+) Transcript_70055:171-785(+)